MNLPSHDRIERPAIRVVNVPGFDNLHSAPTSKQSPSASSDFRNRRGRASGDEDVDGGCGSEEAVPITRASWARRQIGKSTASLGHFKRMVVKYLTFIGPGLMIAVAYMDPGNYSTDVAAGSQFQYALLFVIFLSNIFACFLQSLAAKLGSVTGTDLCTCIRKEYPRRVALALYFFFECSIIATGISEVIGAAIALNILLNIPLVAGCLITVVDTLLVLFFYRPHGGFRGLRLFECFVALLVLAVVICFCVELAKLGERYHVDVGAIFRGYLPSAIVFSSKGIFPSIGILGATVMPHSLILGSSIVLPRVRLYDQAAGNVDLQETQDLDIGYRPSIQAIRSTLPYSIAEIVVSLCTVAIFVNSAILVVAGAAFYSPDGSSEPTADLFAIHDLLNSQIGDVAGVLFALALLFSGESSSIIATMVGQTISEGFFYDQWKVKPWVRRLVTRCIAIVPCLVIAASVGKSGLGAALNGSQVALSVLLPIVSFPLVHFTGSKRIMQVPVYGDRAIMTADSSSHLVADAESDDGTSKPADDQPIRTVDMSNSIMVQILAWAMWSVILGLNVSSP